MLARDGRVGMRPLAVYLSMIPKAGSSSRGHTNSLF